MHYGTKAECELKDLAAGHFSRIRTKGKERKSVTPRKRTIDASVGAKSNASAVSRRMPYAKMLCQVALTESWTRPGGLCWVNVKLTHCRVRLRKRIQRILRLTFPQPHRCRAVANVRTIRACCWHLWLRNFPFGPGRENMQHLPSMNAPKPSSTRLPVEIRTAIGAGPVRFPT